MKTLVEIYKSNPDFYLTDKHNLDHTFSGKSYLDIYDIHFSHFRNTYDSILEIGVSFGGSLRLWNEYFRSAKIHGVDIRDLSDFQKTEGRITVHQEDQSDLIRMSEIGAMADPLSIVVDDGSHIISHILASFDALWRFVLPGGLYVIEDLRLSHDWEQRVQFESRLSELIKEMDYFRGSISTIHFYPMLIIIEKCT